MNAVKKLMHIRKFYEAGVPVCNWTAVIWRSNSIQWIIVSVAALLQFSVDKLINFCASDVVIYCLLSEVFDSFADGNLQRKLDLLNWRVN